jgi:antitoxin MazE
MRSSIQRWGNSLAVRIPRSFATEIGVEQGSAIELFLEEGRLVVSPVSGPRWQLEELLAAVTEENRHGEIEVKGPLGREAW